MRMFKPHAESAKSPTVEAAYENGVLKLASSVPLKEHERVRIEVHEPADVQKALEAARRNFGLIASTGSVADLDYRINDADNDPLEVS